MSILREGSLGQKEINGDVEEGAEKATKKGESAERRSKHQKERLPYRKLSIPT